jgi:C_GCAxxG_C_C family probable redox protein
MKEEPIKVQKVAQRARQIFTDGANCAEAVWQAFALESGLNTSELELGNRLAGGFGGGLGVEDLCGAVAGGIVALGYVFGRFPGEPRNPELKSKCQQFCQRLEQEFGSLHCRDLKEPDNRSQCGLLVATAARILWEQVRSV